MSLRFWISFLVGVILSIGYVSYSRADVGSVAVKRLRSTTVHISSGTGSIVRGKSGRTYILTNAHVCRPSAWKGVLVGHFPDGVTLRGKIVKQAYVQDLCAAEVKREDALKLAPSLKPNQRIWTRGYPGHILSESDGVAHGLFSWNYEFSIEEMGECVPGFRKHYAPTGQLVGCQVVFTSIVTNLYGRPGSSGSPVVDANGDLVGVLSSWLSDQDYDAGMVSYHDVKEFMDSL